LYGKTAKHEKTALFCRVFGYFSGVRPGRRLFGVCILCNRARLPGVMAARRPAFFLGVSFVSFLRRPGWMPPGGRPWLLFDCILFGGLVCAAGRARFFFIHSLNGCFCQKTTNNRL
jgi:hypothetical protein